ncbi:hypothetical protein [Streptomyces sp. NPDC048638]|uniref:hypothetical protein n=1 Tax=Streptomyces sp. NPDC048638 TaxID=3365580 RepID=UPI0037197DDC
MDVIFSGGWSWACYAFLVGYFRQSKIESVILAPLGLAIGVVTYYLFKDSILAAAPDGLQAGASGSGSQIVAWGVLAFAFGAPLGLLGNVARVPGVGGLFFRLYEFADGTPIPVRASARPTATTGCAATR